MSLRRRIMDILEREHLSPQDKVFAIAVLLHANQDGVAWPGTKTLLRLTSIRRKETLYECAKTLEQDGVFERQKRNGTVTRYRFLPARVVDAVIDAYHEQQTGTENSTGPELETGTEKGTGTEKRTGTVFASDRYGKPYPTGTENRTPELYKNNTEPSHTRPMSEFANEHVDARWTDDGRIEVLNGFKAELEKTFPHVDMGLALIQVASETHARSDLKKAILRKFSLIEQVERSKDRRYQEAVQKKSKKDQFTF